MAETDEADYAFWDLAEQSFRVIYSVPLFHEIDSIVNEGYRKIPHGGIEEAGLLFGTIAGNEVHVEALRPIECEHAAGPSLNFSEKDLATLELQIQSSLIDRELEKFKPIGWFLGHTRGGLEMTEAETKHFNRFFPAPGSVTILVKPERFQPTRFCCLVRPSAGRMPHDGSSTAIILPLSGRSRKPGQMTSSIPAPASVVIAKRSAASEESDPEETFADEPVSEAKVAPAGGIWKLEPEQPEEEGERPDHRKLARDRARVIEQAYAVPAAVPVPVNVPPPVSVPVPAPPPFRPVALPSLPRNASRSELISYDEPAYRRSIMNPRAVTVLALAALLGCLVGYVAYLQLPAPVIPIDARPLNRTIVVSWPPEETRNAMYAAVRLDNGSPVPLSAQEKRAGQVAVSGGKDFKAEIVARNWIRDSRGIVRYLQAANK